MKKIAIDPIFIEMAAWVLIITLTAITVFFLPPDQAQGLLRYLLAGATIILLLGYFRSRRLYVESSQKTKQIMADHAELKSRQKTIDLFFNHSTDGIMILNNKQEIVSFSPGMEKITGFDSKDAIGKSAQDFLKFAGDTENSLLPDAVFLPRDVKNRPYIKNTLTTKVGKVIDIEASYASIKENGTHQALAVIRDISYENDLIKRDKEFIAITSHQLNTPLSIVRGYLSLLNQEDKNLTVKQKDYVSEIYQAVKKMISLVEKLLSISRIEEDKIKLEKSEINIANVFSNLEKTFPPTKSTRLAFEVSEKNILLNADPEKLNQVLSNLIDNSFKYTPKGEITVSAQKLRDKVIITVKDTGIGIPEEDLEKIGEKFYRSQNAIDMDNKGTGLGVFIAKTIIEKHGGQLEIHSQKDKGTTIIITLPLGN